MVWKAAQRFCRRLCLKAYSSPAGVDHELDAYPLIRKHSEKLGEGLGKVWTRHYHGEDTTPRGTGSTGGYACILNLYLIQCIKISVDSDVYTAYNVAHQAVNQITPPWSDPPILEWDDENEQHIRRHDVTSAEVEECFDGPHQVMPHRKAKTDLRYADRYAVVGHTIMGRKLMIIVRHKGGGVIRTITSWEIET